MFARPPFVPLFAGVWLVPLILGLIIGPLPHWWSIFLPQPYPEAVTLQVAPYFDADTGCYSAPAAAWRTILASEHAESWFEAVAREGTTPSARLYGLVGLQAIAPTEVPRVVQLIGRRLLTQDVGFWTGERGAHPLGPSPVPLHDLADSASLGGLARLLQHMRSRGEC